MSLILTPHAVRNFAVTLGSRTITHSTLTPTNAVAAIQLRSDGAILIADTDAGLLVVAGVEWLDPESTPEAANYESLWDSSVGSLSSGSEDTWESLATSRTYQKIRTDNGAGTDTVTGTLKIRHAVTLAEVSATITLNATVTV